MDTQNNIALLIGINYIGTSAELRGCQNDVFKMKDVIIEHYNFKEENIKIVVDRAGYIQPTASNIVEQLDNIYLKTKNEKIDNIYIHYSGHGTNMIDKNRDEIDGKDECIVPLDYARSGLITDDYIYSFLSKLNPVKKLIWVFDSCNSASCTDLPYSYTILSSNRIVKQYLSKRKPIPNNKNIFVLSGCLDAKVSYDVSEADGTPCGLLTYNLRKTLDKFGYNCTISQLLTNIKDGFNSLDQNPVLSVNSNEYGFNTLVFEKPIQIEQTETTNTKPTETTQNVETEEQVKPPEPVKPTIDTLNQIRTNVNQLKNLYIQFYYFNSKSRNMNTEQINSNIDDFINKIDKIKYDLDNIKK